MTKDETVGVVIPTFNSATTIVRALESVCQQTLTPTRIIVVDNASSDSTCHEVETFSTRWPTLSIDLVRLETNLGPGGARNIGWDKCATSLVAFLDSDDSWHPRKLELQTMLVREHPDAVLFGHRYLVLDGTGHPADSSGSRLYQSHRYSLRHFLVRNRLSTPTVMLRADIPQRFPTDMWYAEDFSLWTQIVSQTGPAIFSDVVLTYLHKPVYGSSGLSVKLKEMHRGELKVLASLRSAKQIRNITYVITSLWMRLKYVRRRIRGVAT